ncbi:unnamed protein product, partial [Scytosiphon promiscuus]
RRLRLRRLRRKSRQMWSLLGRTSHTRRRPWRRRACLTSCGTHGARTPRSAATPTSRKKPSPTFRSTRESLRWRWRADRSRGGRWRPPTGGQLSRCSTCGCTSRATIGCDGERPKTNRVWAIQQQRRQRRRRRRRRRRQQQMRWQPQHPRELLLKTRHSPLPPTGAAPTPSQRP